MTAARSSILTGILQTISRTLKAELRFDRLRVTSVDWQGYPTLTFKTIRQILVDLVFGRDEHPPGAGEPPPRW
jgi:nicotinate dehydrogenase subunit B